MADETTERRGAPRGRWLLASVAADDKYIEVAKLLRGNDTNVADAEGLLASRGFYRVGLQDEPMASPHIESLLETRGFYQAVVPLSSRASRNQSAS